MGDTRTVDRPITAGRTTSARGVAWATASACAFSLSAVVGKDLLGALGVGSLLFWRFLLASAVLWAILAARRSRGGPDPFGAPWRRIAALGALFGIMTLVGFAALDRLDASVYIVVFYVYPALVVLGSMALGHRLDRVTALALLLVTTGVVLTVPDALTGTDLEDGPLTALCVPASGSMFPIGTTAVNCSVTDAAHQVASATFNVTVLNTAPIVAPLPNMSVTAPGADGAFVNFAPIAVDTQEGPLAAVCTPASGAKFAIGVTTVSCTATDSLGLTDTETFTIEILPPEAPTITTQTLSGGTVGEFYCCGNLFASGRVQPYSWSVVAGALPPGLELPRRENTISGTPTTAGTFTFTVRVTDDLGAFDEKELSITIG